MKEEDYRYPGPKPQTREAAILMLADAVEAATHILTDPTPARIRGAVQKIINAIFVDGAAGRMRFDPAGSPHHRQQLRPDPDRFLPPTDRVSRCPLGRGRQATKREWRSVFRNQQRKVPVETAWLRRVGHKTLRALGRPTADCSVVLVDDAGIAALNRTYRGVVGPTDVLAFP